MGPLHEDMALARVAQLVEHWSGAPKGLQLDSCQGTC